MKHTFYILKQKSTEKVYVGCTTRNVPVRMAEHRYRARQGGNTPLHIAIRENGWDDFEVEILETVDCSKRDSIFMEYQLIEEYNSLDRDFGFNLQLGGNGISPRIATEWDGISYLSLNEASRESGVPLTSLVRTLARTNKTPKTK